MAASHADPIHLLITDVVMPGLSGHELVQQLQPARPALKVLYLSGYAQDAFSPRTTDAQKTFLQKPFTLQSLSRKVREILGHGACVGRPPPSAQRSEAFAAGKSPTAQPEESKPRDVPCRGKHCS